MIRKSKRYKSWKRKVLHVRKEWQDEFCESIRDIATHPVVLRMKLYPHHDWHTHRKKTGDRFHGLTHPRTALKNASKFFDLNEIEKDIIYRHMWPVTFFRVPRTAEGFITTLTDKYCGACETSQRKPKQRKQVMLGSYQ